MRSIFFLFLAFALICVIVADDKAQGDQRVRRDDDREKRSMPKDPQKDQRERRDDEKEKRLVVNHQQILDFENDLSVKMLILMLNVCGRGPLSRKARDGDND
ncbi:unnamed protein product, partial [Mesorhabditis belari]|uniref:Uncharacterized protein n=1 Tax=Mesorhabditis belari TaxID=2138241 RepID=A0AAF3EJ00_9BILA